MHDEAVNATHDRLALAFALYIFFALLGCSCSVIASLYVFDGAAIIGFLVAFLPFVLLGLAVARIGRINALPEDNQAWLRRTGILAVWSSGLLFTGVLFMIVFLHKEVDKAFSLISLSAICMMWMVGVLLGAVIVAYGGRLPRQS